MAVDTKSKRLNVTNMLLRQKLGIVPSGSVTESDRENYSWFYFPFDAPDPGEVAVSQFKYNIGPTIGPGM